MTEPPVPRDLDVRSFPYMPLEVDRLRASDLALLSSGEEFRSAVLLWCAAWHQVPASSLPNDDRVLAGLAGWGRDLASWEKVKTVALRGFKLCSDGRLYHSLIAGRAMTAWDSKVARTRRTEAATNARKNNKLDRNDQRDDRRNDQRNGHQLKLKQRLEQTESVESSFSKKLESAQADISPGDALTREVVSFSEMDFISSDGAVRFSATEIAELERDLPAVKNLRGQIRNAARVFSNVSGQDRKRAILAHLGKKEQAAHERQDRQDAKAKAATPKPPRREGPAW